MYRTHNCGELRVKSINTTVQLAGWVQRIRDKKLGGNQVYWIDLRDRYGITQLMIEEGKSPQKTLELAKTLGREYVIQIQGTVIERVSKNPKLPTGDIEILVNELNVLNTSKTPPFTIEDNTDGGDELRMKYRYLDLRRNILQKALLLRHKLIQETRKYLDGEKFIEVETPMLIKSTPEGARDFLVPARMHPGEFYALPQSPQTFKQLLMVAGMDKYYQIVKCFRDEDLRADRQPEFTQIDCEMSFVSQKDITNMFEGLVKHLFKAIKDVALDHFPVMTYQEAMESYGNDKPDIRFEMKIKRLNKLTQNKGFQVFDQADCVLGICAKNAAEYTRKQLDKLTDFVKQPQIGAKGLVYVKYNHDGTFKSSVDKFFEQDTFIAWAQEFGAEPGDLILILAGEEKKTIHAISELRLEMGDLLGLKDKDIFKPLWIVDFPLVEWDEESQRYHAMHHPFTSPKADDIEKLTKDPANVCANAYDLVINGVEIGGGSIRIHDRNIQQKMFNVLGFSEKEAQHKFGFLLNAFEYGAPPHGGIAFGLDRLCALMGGSESIRDYIAFPKNNAGRDVMIDTPASVDNQQLDELGIKVLETIEKE